MKNKIQSSWESVESWYDKSVGPEGHYYHQQIVLPGALRLLELEEKSALLDLACGQGILARHLPQGVSYTGVDASPSLVKAAKQYSSQRIHKFQVGDVTQPLSLPLETFSHATILLALQNIADPLAVLQNAARHLQPGGKLVIVLNHPCFRIPRQSSWQIDEAKKIQYRRIDRYFTPMEIPIQMHPSKKETSTQTWSFHQPLSAYSRYLKQAGFMIECIDEWCSDKKSIGKTATMENRSREEFPLFLAISARNAEVARNAER